MEGIRGGELDAVDVGVRCFLDEGFVMGDDARLRGARLALLARGRDILGRLGDLSELD